MTIDDLTIVEGCGGQGELPTSVLGRSKYLQNSSVRVCTLCAQGRWLGGGWRSRPCEAALPRFCSSRPWSVSEMTDPENRTTPPLPSLPLSVLGELVTTGGSCGRGSRTEAMVIHMCETTPDWVISAVDPHECATSPIREGGLAGLESG